MAEQKNMTLYRGDDYDSDLTFTMTTNGSVAGWLTQFTLRKTPTTINPPTIQVVGVTVDAGSVVTPGVFKVTLTQAQLLGTELRDYLFSFKRVNPGAARVLTKGIATVESDVEHPA